MDLADDDTQNTLGAGMDFLSGASMEALRGGPFNDTLIGTSGMNRIDGSGGADAIRALGGDDTVAARDGAGDTVDCGTGLDAGVFDAPGVDSVTGCESAAFRDVVVRLLTKGTRQKLRTARRLDRPALSRRELHRGHPREREGRQADPSLQNPHDQAQRRQPGGPTANAQPPRCGSRAEGAASKAQADRARAGGRQGRRRQRVGQAVLVPPAPLPTFVCTHAD